VVIRKSMPLLAPLLALASLLTIGGAGPSLRTRALHREHHARCGQPCCRDLEQEPCRVRGCQWSSGDGTVAAPYANWTGITVSR